MSSTNLTFRFIAILSVLTIINMLFFGVSWHKKSQSYGCTVDNVIDSLTSFIRKNGDRKLEEELPETCRQSEKTSDAAVVFKNALTNLTEYCRKKSNSVHSSDSRSQSVIVLFTTWSTDPSKVHIHNTTLKNWASLKPEVEIIVFTNSSEDSKLADSFGARTLPILKHGGGSPVLKWMFTTVIDMYNRSQLFGYVNSDILFTSSLVDTLKSVIRTKDMNKPFFLVGRRINVEDILQNETETFSDIEKVAKDRGQLFGANAEDFFITNSKFPWQNIIDVVVGRLAYDNWIVGHVICKLKIDVIDITDTVLAVHQTTKIGGNFEGFKSKDAHFNNALFKKLGIVPQFDTGFTICSQELTRYDLCGLVGIYKRRTFWEKCKCPTTVLF